VVEVAAVEEAVVWIVATEETVVVLAVAVPVASIVAHPIQEDLIQALTLTRGLMTKLLSREGNLVGKIW
jgi:high-affinity nickel permease